MEAHDVQCISLDCRGRAQYPTGLLRLATILRRERIDILHTHLFEPSVIGLQAGALARTQRRVMTRHYSDYHTRIDKRWHVKLDQMCTALSHRVIAVSHHTATHLVEAEGASREKIRVVWNGIDFDRVRASEGDPRGRVRQELGLGDDYVLLIAARLHPEKGYDHLFPALREAIQRLNRKVILLVAGEGQLVSRYREQVRALGLEASVRFLGFRTDLPDLMLTADLFVLPSVAEAFGLVLTEAIYLGTPVVATRVGGIPEIVDDGIDGVLVPPADSAALAAAITDLLCDEERRRRMSGAGSERIAQRFRFETMVRAYERVYDELPNGNRND